MGWLLAILFLGGTATVVALSSEDTPTKKSEDAKKTCEDFVNALPESEKKSVKAVMDAISKDVTKVNGVAVIGMAKLMADNGHGEAGECLVAYWELKKAEAEATKSDPLYIPPAWMPKTDSSAPLPTSMPGYSAAPGTSNPYVESSSIFPTDTSVGACEFCRWDR